jgi:pimeloyl-ACP methyl ester carboxylesterase/DNA-binding CsgD family transcriptional regulator
MRQQVRFCTSFDGTRIAYAVTGEGPPLVRAPHWFSHLEHDWTNPAFQPWVGDLSKRYAFLRFDQRGCGLSDRQVSEISPEAHVRDLEAVVDAAGFDRFAIFGASQGGAFAVAYAARHPERVSHLVLYGAFARGWNRRGGSAVDETQVRLIELGWGRDEPSFRQVFTTQFMPDAGLDTIRAFNDLMPLTSSAKTAAAIFRTNGDIDMQAEARAVRCPTLVAHGTGDLRIPFEEGRRIAGLIPGAQFVSLETRNHLMTPGDPAWARLLDAIVEFYPPAARGKESTTAGFPNLTAREREVLEFIAQGLDNAQIAARLELSEKTVRNNITHIFDKIGVENRSQAIVLARESGLGSARQP